MRAAGEGRRNGLELTRRSFVRVAGLTAGIGAGWAHAATRHGAGMVDLSFTRGERRLAAFPEKAPLILLRTRPPLLETPFSVFDKGVFTPNDLFYVRWHLPAIPATVDVRQSRLTIAGHVEKPLTLTLDELVNRFESVEYAAVNQCSGNSRGFFQPRVPGGQWANGAMGNAIWTGVPVKSLLQTAGVKAGAIQVRFHGMDEGNPRFMKTLALDHALEGEVMVAYAMNRAPMPLLNGFPVRLVVPGWYSTYWVKMLNHIEVLNRPDDNFWMCKAYLIPDTPNANMKPGQAGVHMVPINRMVPRSFITNLPDGAAVRAHETISVRGIAFGGDTGVRQVLLSEDDGRTWRPAQLEKDYGKYSFRRWTSVFVPSAHGEYTLAVRAVNLDGLTQPLAPSWNPSGFMRNAVERVRVRAV